MAIKYNYKSSIEFINNLEFDYIETYSLQRGIAFEEQARKGFNDLGKLKRRADKKQDLSASEISKLEDLKKRYGVTQYIINAEGKLHPTAKKTGTFKSNNPIVKKLKSILNTPIKQIPSWMCAPIYRDAIIFYDSNHNIISAIDVCLSCELMETKMFNHINADVETYGLMRTFFIELGHKVETQ